MSKYIQRYAPPDDSSALTCFRTLYRSRNTRAFFRECEEVRVVSIDALQQICDTDAKIINCHRLQKVTKRRVFNAPLIGRNKTCTVPFWAELTGERFDVNRGMRL